MQERIKSEIHASPATHALTHWVTVATTVLLQEDGVADRETQESAGGQRVNAEHEQNKLVGGVLLFVVFA